MYTRGTVASRVSHLEPILTRLARLRELARRLDPALYTLWAAACTIASARSFYLYMLKQTGGEWSAPLDDVFIHFDFARSTARGHPFEWIEGNGYSSGNTSILYPFVLAVGYIGGFRDLRLMAWAAIVAAVSVFVTLLVARRIFFAGPSSDDDGATRLFSYLLPPMVLGVGALDWSLWSGMEVAFFLAVWSLALAAYFRLGERTRPDRARARGAWVLGLCGAVLVLTRPEAVTTIAIFGIAAALPRWRLHGTRPVVAELARIGSPSVLVVAAQSIANRALTGEWSANGALVKLALNNPYFGRAEKLDDYNFNLHYAVLRNVEYHFADLAPYGVIIPALAAAAIAAPRTRRMALLLGTEAAAWLVLVSLNGQVRWQNERYTMPAVAWVLMVAALGASALVRSGKRARPTFVVMTLLGTVLAQLYGLLVRPPNTAATLQYGWLFALAVGAAIALALRPQAVRVLGVAAALVLAHEHQESKMRDQKWFFGRASRNIRDQHVVTGRWLRTTPLPLVPLRDGYWGNALAKRVLLGDAGAIPYAADIPALDIIGLGGFHSFPFARADINGLASTIELMEYVPPNERPDVMAIYPSWWGILPTWFSSGVLARIPVEGNVICGGYEDVVYRADWHLLGTGNDPRLAPQGEAVRDELDAADILSEKRHAYVSAQPEGGYTELKVLADPADPTLDMLDGGRRMMGGQRERFVLRKLDPNRAAHLVVRSAPERESSVRVVIDGAEIARVPFEASEAWVERVVAIPALSVKESIEVTLLNDGPGDFLDYHVWITQ